VGIDAGQKTLAFIAGIAINNLGNSQADTFTGTRLCPHRRPQ
jgi:hypothetical protein